jgi:hypothetical protein
MYLNGRPLEEKKEEEEISMQQMRIHKILN